MRKALLLPLLLVAGCASAPSGPGVLVLPGSSKSFDQFRVDESGCRKYASAQAASTTEAANSAAAASAAVGTAIGAVTGAAFGGQSGAAVGATMGLATGALVGSSNAQFAGRTAQQRYDVGYQQCMYAKGHKVPMAGRYEISRQVARRAAPPPPPPPPPPQGTPPGIPPDYRG
jgi:hypothetical protein